MFGLPPEVEQVRAALVRDFANLIDLNGCSGYPFDARDHAFLTRALAAQAARLVSGCSAAEAAEAVIDGVDDFGIDAVACSAESSEIWLVQAKWSDQGTARVHTETVHTLVNGLRQLIELRYERFNSRFQRLASRVDAVLNAPTCRIHLVLAVLGDEGPPARHNLLLADVVAKFGLRDLIDVRVLGIADFHSAARQSPSIAEVALTATLTGGWFASFSPFQAFHGMVSAAELASWFQEHGERLFSRNLRGSLGVTRVNEDMVTGLVTNASEFAYLNNGITVTCDTVRTEYFARRAEGQPARLLLASASVVNGAQTIASAHRALTQAPEAVAEALVPIRVICLDGTPSDLGPRIARAANAHNQVDPQDLAALDPQQDSIRDGFARSLGKSYVYKRGELLPAPEAGCSMAEAALALACTHSDSDLVARLRQDSECLWRRGPEGVYPQLFGASPGPLQIWRSVILMRRVGDALAAMSDDLTVRGRGVADVGRLLITHLVFVRVGADGMDDAAEEWETRLESELRSLPLIMALLIHQVDQRYGKAAFLGPVFRSKDKSRELVDGVLSGLCCGAETPLPTREPRRPRRPSTVSLLVEKQRIMDSTGLAFRTGSPVEQAALQEWLSANPSRFLAFWVNDRHKPLIWAVDGQQYSPGGLVQRIWEEAGWTERPLSVHGTQRWYLPGEGTLSELADRLRVAEADNIAD